MSQIIVNPLQWTDLRDIDEVRPIDDDDAECLEEIRVVLQKHNSLDRFGIALLHSHFQIADDELLMETTDVAEREHWVRRIKKNVVCCRWGSRRGQRSCASTRMDTPSNAAAPRPATVIPVAIPRRATA